MNFFYWHTMMVTLVQKFVIAELSAFIARGSKLIKWSPAKLVTLDNATQV